MAIYKEDEITALREAGKAAPTILLGVSQKIRPGISALKLDTYAGELMEKLNVKSAPKTSENFPGNTCISINNTIAHGVPKKRVLRCNDMVNIDIAVVKNGFQ